MSNRVLVVTPTWCTKENNRLPLLLQTVYWVQQQTHDDFLHVVVDDGSTDDTWDYLCELAGKSNRIMLLHQENKGSSAAINYGVEQGLRHSNSKYVTVTHSDDLLLPHSLEKRVMDAENAKARFVYTDMIVFRENGESYVQEALEFPTSTDMYQGLIQLNVMNCPTMFWEREFFTECIRGYDSDIRSAEDWDIALRTATELIRNNAVHSCSHAITAAYRMHENCLGLSNIRDGTTWNCYKKIYRKHLSGFGYDKELVKGGVRIIYQVLPELMKTPLRRIKRSLIGQKHKRVPYTGDFLQEVTNVDYKVALANTT